MQTVSTLAELRLVRSSLMEPVGLVPTMGYLHEGHLSLVRRARADCASVAVSIFVNPTQFGPNEDLAAYPRDLPRDLRLLSSEGVDLVWTPTPAMMYRPGFETWVTVDELAARLEGQWRPSHFRGVTTVVAKLFNAVLPQKAYFGQKDAQQTIVLKQMVRDLNFPVDVVVCPTVREADGLAMSSRNAYLRPDERRAASVLFQALTAALDAFQEGERQAQRLRRIVEQTIANQPLVQLQYVSCADPVTLQELELVADVALLSLAALVGHTRLIDNLVLRVPQ